MIIATLYTRPRGTPHDHDGVDLTLRSNEYLQKKKKNILPLDVYFHEPGVK